MQWHSRPVILVGHGCRMAGIDMERLSSLGIPLLFSWQAMDLLDSDHPMNFGRPGLYGQRAANKILYNANQVVAIGCRMSIWQCGYDQPAFSPNAKIMMVDIDQAELDSKPWAKPILMDAKAFVETLVRHNCLEWLQECRAWMDKYPWIESPTHDDANGYIHSHQLMKRLQPYLKPDQIIVTDMGTPMIAAHQVLRLKPPQRIMTSGGLGEMGMGLPAAIGASFATNKGEVLCLEADGSMMMNLQELQTIAHHQLPIKIIVFSNNGYGMIKQTQKAAGYERVASDSKSGVSCPDFQYIGNAFEIMSRTLSRSFIDMHLETLFEAKVPMLLQVKIDPEQPMLPKLNPVRKPDGTLGSPAFWDLSLRI